MALRSPTVDKQFAGAQSAPVKSHSQAVVPLEKELHEGDGRIPGWLWLVVASVAIFAALAAPFQLFGSFGG